MSKKTHILLLSSWYPTKEKPFLGNFVRRQAELLSIKYQVSIINTISDSTVKDINTKENVYNEVREITVRHSKSKSFFKKRKEQANAFSHGLSLVTEIDLIIGNVALSKSWQFIEAKKKFNVPLIYIEHGSFFRTEIKTQRNIVEKYLLWQLKKNVNEIVAVSDFLKKDMQTDFKGRDIKIIGNHVDSELFSLSPPGINNDRTEFLHISTLDKQTKNAAGIIRACSILKKSGGNFRLTIISDEDGSLYKELAIAEGVFNEIDFVGPLKWEETVPYYHKADAFILFSHYETFSIVLAEAMMTGTPVISTSVGIATELNKNLGLNVENNNVSELASAMMEITSKSESYSKKEIREFAMNYSQESILQKWTTLIDSYVD
ncbi:MAG TPA: glycosyltransferase [Crocinitomicaceae bacterium]|nr:glycosyltransferase [Crocinitomicaceae bacterium]